MSIQINLPHNTCSAGSIITGTVSLHGEEDIYLQSITVVLQAHCETRWTERSGQNRDSTTYYGKVRLFKVSKELLKGPHTLHPGHSWPFTFQLPLQCDAPQIKRFQGKCSAFNYDREQSLPPSFRGVRRDLSCSCTYEIQASLRRGTFRIFSSRHLLDTKQLYLRTLRDSQTLDRQFNRETQAIECFSPRPEKGHEDTPSTLKEKWRSLWMTKPPDATFKVDTALPKFVILGQSFRVYCRLHNDSEKSTPIQPSVLLSTAYSMTLEECTYIRDDRDERSVLTRSHAIAPFDFSKKMEADPQFKDFLDSRNYRMRFKVKLPSHFTPTFTTFNIMHKYRLHFRFNVPHGQKILEPRFFTPEFILLPEDCKPSEGEDLRVASSSTTGDAAPAYQQVVEPAPPSYHEAEIS